MESTQALFQSPPLPTYTIYSAQYPNGTCPDLDDEIDDREDDRDDIEDELADDLDKSYQQNQQICMNLLMHYERQKEMNST